VEEMLKEGLIQPSTNAFSSPMLLVKKKDKGYRFYVDYRHHNAITVKGSFLVPVIDELLDELGQASWFSTLDLCAGFHQISMEPSNCFKTPLQTHVGHYEFREMSFGLTGAPHTFQRAMNSTLAPLLRKNVLVFFDDILVYSKSYSDYVMHLKEMFQLLLDHQWKVKLSKCSFAQRQISYLGYIINENGLANCPNKIKIVVDWPTPSCVKELRSFLGLTGYYRRFIKHFGIISRPLNDLLKKNCVYVWTN
jgi:hypothetical protein